MESIVNSLSCILQNNTFEFGFAGLILSVLLLIGLIYLFINRHQIMTLTYGITLLSMFIFTIFCILAMLLAGIYGVTLGSSNQQKQVCQNTF